MVIARQQLQDFLDRCPLVAILRGVRPEEIVDIGLALFETGFRIIEVPLNSPDPLRSIEMLASELGEQALVGAGTVLQAKEVASIRDAGGRIIVSPSTDATVIEATVAAGLLSAPGYFTPSEAFTALAAGAHALKLFPAEAAAPAVVKAQRAVLPVDVPVIVVGGVTPQSMAGYWYAGANGFGLGSSLYQARRTVADVASRAREYLEALHRITVEPHHG